MNQIIIPICVEAYLSNGKESDTGRVPVVTPDYRKVSYTSFLGSKNTPGDFQTAPVLKAGAHLHFILPSALTHAGKDGYPPVPDRYLVTRFYVSEDDSEIQAKCFVVESNFISLAPQYEDSITIPVFEETDLRKNWRYLGRSYPAGSRPQETESDGYLENLTAVGAGDVMFAAYYPSCSSVFGFYDDLRDVPQNAPLTYFVIGYYSHTAKDSFHDIQTRRQFQDMLLRMNFSMGQIPDTCSRSVFFGEITGVLWKGTDAEYGAQPAGEIYVTAGNTSPEALSAALVRQGAVPEDTQRLLTALQYDLAGCEEQADGNYKIDDEIYLRQFQRIESGEAAYRPVCGKNGHVWEGAGRPFSDYCKEAARLAEWNRQLESLRSKLFYSWEQYMYCYEDPGRTPQGVPSAQKMLDEIVRICVEEIREMEKQTEGQAGRVRDCFKKLKAAMGVHGKVVQTAGAPFYAPKDPVIMLSGQGVRRAYAFGEDGRFTSDGTLWCQTDVIKTDIGQEDLLGCISESGGFLESVPLDGYEELLCQALLLSGDVRPFLNRRFGGVSVGPDGPSEIAQNTYHKDPVTLFMAWEAEYLPVYMGGKPEDALKDWEYNEDQTNYTYTGTLRPDRLLKLYLSGRTVLTPHAVIHFSDTLKKWIRTHPSSPEMERLAEEVRNLGVISQNLDGFTKQLLSLKRAYQFPVMGAGGDEAAAALVSGCVAPQRDSVNPQGTLVHLRAGMFTIRRLWLVGTFGQKYDVLDSSYYGRKEITFAESMEPAGDGYAFLPPAFCQPVRITFRFASAQDDSVDASALPETSPVIAIILPELLNNRLMVYGPAGAYLGCIQAVYSQEKSGSCGTATQRERMASVRKKLSARWLDAHFPGRPLEEADVSDLRLKAFLQAFLDTAGALSDMLWLIRDYYDKKLVPHTENPVFGRPFVLVRCGVRFAYAGLPEFVKDVTGFGKYDTLGAEQIRFPVLFGGWERVTDGLLGCFDDQYGFGGMIPASGATVPGAGKYLLPPGKMKLCAGDGEKMLTAMMAPHAGIMVHTGLMPGLTASLEACHASVSDEILAAVEMNPVVACADQVMLPAHGYSWQYRSKQNYICNKILPPDAHFRETVVMDGFLVKEKQDE